MKLTFRNLKQISHEIDNIEPTDTIESICYKVKELYNFPDNARLIYCGRILEKHKTIQDYFSIDDSKKNNFVICIPEKSNKNEKVSQNVQEIDESIQHNVNINTEEEQQEEIIQEENYTLNDIRSLVILYTEFLRSHPDIFHTFCTNSLSFQNFLTSDVFINSILKSLLQKCGQVTEAIDNRTDVIINIPIVQNNNISHTSIESNLSSQNRQNNLTEQDKENIRELETLGFSNEITTEAYIMSGKNKELAKSALFELQNV